MMELDPEWEYWDGGDPEIREILDAASQTKDFDGVDDFRMSKYEKLGIRFGKGNPNRIQFRLGRAKRTRESNIVAVPCKGCKSFFLPDRSSALYCSRNCYKPTGRKKEYDPFRKCLFCLEEFYATDKRNISYCSRKCGSRHAAVRWTVKREGDGCLVCGKSIPPSKNKNGISKVYCSRHCGTIYRKRKSRIPKGDDK